MKSVEKDINLLEDFIRGKLDKESSDLIEARLLNEESLKEDYQDLLIFIHGTKVTKLTNKLTMLQELETSGQTPNKPWLVRMKPIHRWLAAAVILGAIAITALLLNQDKLDKYPAEYADLFEKRFEPELILHKTYRSALPTAHFSPEQLRAFEIYSIKQFKTAKPLLKELWEEKRDTLALFYWGVSEIGSGEVEKGKEILKMDALSKYQTIIKLFN